MPKQDARYGYHPWIALISLVGAGFILLAYVLWSAYQDVWAEARSVASSQAELLEARFDATLRRVESTLDDMAVRVPAEAFRPGSGIDRGPANHEDRLARRQGGAQPGLDRIHPPATRPQLQIVTPRHDEGIDRHHIHRFVGQAADDPPR